MNARQMNAQLPKRCVTNPAAVIVDKHEAVARTP